MKYCFGAFFIIIFCTPLFAQGPLFSLYHQNYLWHNPAYAGEEDKKVFNLTIRNQWITSDGNPLTFNFSYDQPVTKYNSAFGFNVMYDQFGPQQNIEIGSIYNYRLTFNDNISLRLGGKFSIISQSLDFSKFIYGGFEQLPTEKLWDIKPAFDAGTWLNIKNFFVGFSSKHINAPVFIYADSIRSPIEQHFYFNAGYEIKLDETLKTIPSIIFRRASFSGIMEANNTFIYRSKYHAGISYRGINSANPIIFNAGYDIKEKLLLMLAYDLPGNFGGSLEGCMKYRF